MSNKTRLLGQVSVPFFHFSHLYLLTNIVGEAETQSQTLAANPVRWSHGAALRLTRIHHFSSSYQSARVEQQKVFLSLVEASRYIDNGFEDAGVLVHTTKG